MIVKLARHQVSLHGIPQVTVLSQDAKVVFTVPMCEELAVVFGDSPSLYAEATLHGDGTLQLNRRVEDQSW
jgi:hypothetical protein